MERKMRRRKPKRVVHDIATCENAIFDERWGEYKCKARQHRIPDVEQYCTDCKDYKQKKGEGR